MPMEKSEAPRSLLVLAVCAVIVAAMGAWLSFAPVSGPVSGQVSSPAMSTAARSPAVAGGTAVAGFDSAMTFNAAAGNSIKLVLAGDVLSSSIANPSPGQFLTLLLCQDDVGARTMSWPANLKLAGGSFPLTPSPNQCDALTAVYDGNNWYEIARSMNE
ncbi:MAG: hypothetical protein HY316_01455 [Acidobacteria bacterium]|nr:hypothetical protein [Acidobacteriota bacterium]